MLILPFYVTLLKCTSEECDIFEYLCLGNTNNVFDKKLVEYQNNYQNDKLKRRQNLNVSSANFFIHGLRNSFRL